MPQPKKNTNVNAWHLEKETHNPYPSTDSAIYSFGDAACDENVDSSSVGGTSSLVCFSSPPISPPISGEEEGGLDWIPGDGYGFTPLHFAAAGCQSDVCIILLDNGAQADAKNKEGQTALHCAAGLGLPWEAVHRETEESFGELCTILIKRGAHPDNKDNLGFTPLHFAAFMKLPIIAKNLIEFGASVTAKTNTGGTPLHLAADSSLPTRQNLKGHNCFDICNTLIEHGALTIEQNLSGVTPLHLAIKRSGDTKLCLMLLKKTDDLTKFSDKGPRSSLKEYPHDADIPDDTTLLHFASKIGTVEIADALIKKGVNVHAINSEEDTSLHWATRYNNTEMVALLLNEGANVNAINSEGETPLHNAAQHTEKMVGLLLNKDANAYVSNSRNILPLNYAALNGNVEVARMLIIPTFVRSFSETALEQARKRIKTALLLFTRFNVPADIQTFVLCRLKDLQRDIIIILCSRFINHQIIPAQYVFLTNPTYLLKNIATFAPKGFYSQLHSIYLHCRYQMDNPLGVAYSDNQDYVDANFVDEFLEAIKLQKKGWDW